MYSMQRSISEHQVQHTSSFTRSKVKKSQSLGNCTIEKERGFKPSDRYDPAKKEFLVNLSKKIWQKESTSTAGPKSINLQKLFTPATDAEEILPKNRKLYASSAFYSPNLHPTVEDQVELARRISHSLSDISNQQSKGQSMYVNRKKRSVKWVHEGEGKADIKEYNGYSEDTKENGYESKTSSSSVYHDKVPLKLVMNPRGQIRDFSQYQDDFKSNTGLLSPDKCAELVTALQAPKGKGAELFAKRRKKAENWIVDETTAATRSPSGIPYKPTSPIVPAYSDVGIHHVQLNMHQDQVIQDKYATNQRLKMIKTPWDSTLETGSPVNAFQEIAPKHQQQNNSFYASAQTQQQTTATDQYFPTYESEQKSQLYKNYSRQPSQPNNQRDLAYKPSVPQGWNAPPPMLPSELYTPPQIPLDSYVPPSTEKYFPTSTGSAYSASSIYSPSSAPSANTTFPRYQETQQHQQQQSYNTFPISKSAYNTSSYSNQKTSSSYSSTYGGGAAAGAGKPISSAWSPQNDPQPTKAASTTFNPSPLSYEKLAKFENPDPDDPYANINTAGGYHQPASSTYQSVYRKQQHKTQNVSPTPFASAPRTTTSTYPPPTSSNSFQPVVNASRQSLSSSVYHSGAGGYQPSDDNLYAYGGGDSQPPSSRVSSVDLSQCHNYNTAPRGWTQMHDYYRPITFAQGATPPNKHHSVELPYTDF